MILDLKQDILAGQACPSDLSPQIVDYVTNGVIARYCVIGIAVPQLEGASNLTFVSGEDGPIDGDVCWADLIIGRVYQTYSSKKLRLVLIFYLFMWSFLR